MKVAVASLLLASAVPGIFAQPTGSLEKRADFCGQWDSEQSGPYIVYNNLWNMGTGTGSQCTGVDGIDGSTLAWHTSWSWSGGQGQVKSYANAVLADIVSNPRAISDINSIPSTWRWSYSGSSLVANVAYDLFTSSSPSGSEEYEVMIWLAALGGAGPISETGSPIANPTVAGVNWNLFEGYNGNMHVYSFVAAGGSVENFSGDLKDFLNYLGSEQGMDQSQYVINIGAGTEPFSGNNAVFTTSAYSVQVQ
ncbi:hypothetical protein VTO42DRAFT_170 [Malbranchea cinnamomea]